MRTCKLLLLQPPIQDFYDTTIRLQPLGLCYLKAAVNKWLPECEVVVKDYHHGRGRRTIPLPKALIYLKRYYAFPDKSPFSSFYHYYHFGMSFDELVEDVAASQPDLIGISSLFSPYYREVLQCAQAIKQRLNVPIIVGGSHVSADPEGMLRHDCIDFVVRGEGERPLVEFLQAWKVRSEYDHVPNLGFKQHGNIVLNPIEPNYALDEIPAPDVSDFLPETYQFEQRPLCFLITSRGCPHHCAFCSVHLTFGKSYRKRSIDAIIQEIRKRYDEGYRVFDFEDDNLTFDREGMKDLCEQLMNTFPEGDIQLLAMNGLSYLSLDRGLLGLMKQAGFTHLNLSLVSANADIMRQLNRPHLLEHYHAIVCEGAQLGFKMVSYQILGLPQELLESMIQTLVLNTQLPVLLGASPFYLTPSSPIAHDFPPLCEDDIFKARLTAMAIETPSCTRGDLFTLFLTTRILNFLKGFSLSGYPSVPSLTPPRRTWPLAEALDWAESQGGRMALGVNIFRKLFDQQILFAAVGKRFEPVQHFRPKLFFQVWSQLRYVCTQEGILITEPHEV